MKDKIIELIPIGKGFKATENGMVPCELFSNGKDIIEVTTHGNPKETEIDGFPILKFDGVNDYIEFKTIG